MLPEKCGRRRVAAHLQEVVGEIVPMPLETKLLAGVLAMAKRNTRSVKRLGYCPYCGRDIEATFCDTCQKENPTLTSKRTTKTVDLRPICKAIGLPEPVPEFKFHPKRKWRFDWFFPFQRSSSSNQAFPVALEIEGGAWIPGGGRHTRGKGFEQDIEKYNEAACMGILIIRCTPTMLQDGRAWKWLERLLK